MDSADQRFMTPTRETFGNIPAASQWLFYALSILSMVVFAWGVWRRVKLWRVGQPVGIRESLRGRWMEVWGRWKPGVKRVAVEGLGQERVKGRGWTSAAHIGLFIGFMMLFLGTTLLEIDHLAGKISESWSFHHGNYYVVYELVLDVAGLLFLVGCFFFLWRRLQRPSSLGHRLSDYWVILSFIAIGVTGYLVEGLRIGWQKPTGLGAQCSPVGLWISHAFSGWNESSVRGWHWAVWWLHSLLVLGFIASIPFTRLFHFIAGPLNLLLAK
ncbi:MAG: hypothetical protein FJ405_13135, partial [Verrucomicrobia bacterium]|nr:hypothetical protein [Verrucomicrobiota bacterium]